MAKQDDDDGMLSSNESADLDMPDVVDIEADKDRALATLLAAASAAGTTELGRALLLRSTPFCSDPVFDAPTR